MDFPKNLQIFYHKIAQKLPRKKISSFANTTNQNSADRSCDFFAAIRKLNRVGITNSPLEVLGNKNRQFYFWIFEQNFEIHHHRNNYQASTRKDDGRKRELRKTKPHRQTDDDNNKKPPNIFFSFRNHHKFCSSNYFKVHCQIFLLKVSYIIFTTLFIHSQSMLYKQNKNS